MNISIGNIRWEDLWNFEIDTLDNNLKKIIYFHFLYYPVYKKCPPFNTVFKLPILFVYVEKKYVHILRNRALIVTYSGDISTGIFQALRVAPIPMRY